MSARFLPASDYAQLKGATRRLLRKVGGTHAGAEATRVGQQTLSAYGNNHEDYELKFIPVDVAADLEAEAGAPIVTRILARLSGHYVVPMPSGEGFSELQMLAGKSAKEFGDVMVRLGEALKDGKLDQIERDDMMREIDEAIMALSALRKSINKPELESDQ